MTRHGRELPVDVELEQLVLNRLLIAPEAVLDGLSPSDFYDRRNALVFGSVQRIRGRGAESDVASVRADLEDDNLLAVAGGAERLHELVRLISSPGAYRHHVERIRMLAVQRRLVELSADLGKAAMHGDEAAISTAVTAISEIEQPRRDVVATDVLKRIDLAPAWRGQRLRPETTILRRSDGECLFPAGINYMFGDSGDGKSWIELVAALQQMQAGRAVVWITYEDPNEDDIVERLQLLGAHEDDLEYIHVFAPTEPFTLLTHELARYCRKVQAVRVVLDSVGEALAVEGVNEDKDNEFGPWARQTLRRLYDLACTTDPKVIDGEPCPALSIGPIDHSTKSKDNPHFPSGTKRKRAMVTGTMLSVNVRQPFARGQVGRVQLVNAKDRLGRFRRGEIVAEFTLDATVEPYAVSIDPPRAGSEMTTGKKRTAVERVMEVIAGASVALTAGEVARIANSDTYRHPNELELAERTVQNTLSKLTGIIRQKEPTGTAGGYKITYSPTDRGV